MTESEEVLMAIIDAVNRSGGITVDANGDPIACVGGNPSATLADVYMRACAVLGEEEVTQTIPKAPKQRGKARRE